MLEVGVEPTCPCEQWILSPLRSVQMVPRERIELSWVTPHDFESCAKILNTEYPIFWIEIYIVLSERKVEHRDIFKNQALYKASSLITRYESFAIRTVYFCLLLTGVEENVGRDPRFRRAR